MLLCNTQLCVQLYKNCNDNSANAFHSCACLQTSAFIYIYLLLFSLFFNFFGLNQSPHRGSADAKIKVPSAQNQELTNVLLIDPGAGQNTALHASPTARNFFLVLICPLPVHSPSFLFPNILLLMLYPWNKIGHLFMATSDLSKFP